MLDVVSNLSEQAKVVIFSETSFVSPQEYHSVLSSNHGVTPRVYQRPGLNEYKEGFYSTCQVVPGVEQPD